MKAQLKKPTILSVGHDALSETLQELGILLPHVKISTLKYAD